MEQPESILRMTVGGVCLADDVEAVMPIFHLVSNRQGFRSLSAQLGLEASRVIGLRTIREMIPRPLASRILPE